MKKGVVRMKKGKKIRFTDSKNEPGEESSFPQDAVWFSYVTKNFKYWWIAVAVFVVLVFLVILMIPCTMWRSDICCNWIIPGAAVCATPDTPATDATVNTTPTKATDATVNTTPEKATDATVNTTPTNDFDEATTTVSPEPTVAALSPKEGLRRQMEEQDSLGCAPRPVIKNTRELLHPEDSLPDKFFFYPPKIIVNQCSDKTSICEGNKTCLPTKEGEEAKKFFLALFKRPTLKEVDYEEKVAYNIKEHTSCSCQ